MNLKKGCSLLVGFAAVFIFTCYGLQAQTVDEEFLKVNALDWKLSFEDDCKGDWQQKWFLDGEKATLMNDEEGMSFTAGPKARVDAHHAVLWTRDEFSGDIKMEWDYTRLDSASEFVTIVYLLASGNPQAGVKNDISKWAKERSIPAMRSYFNKMDLLHISYAAYYLDSKNDGVTQYIRARRYRPELKQGLKGTDLGGFNLDFLFEMGKSHHITVIKKDHKLFMQISNEKASLLYSWDLSQHPDVTDGRVGLRHMYTRAARYKNIKIYGL
ncbi:MAG: DUF1961 family protein [Bacteroidota bacterium]